MNRASLAILCLVLTVQLPLGVGAGTVICFGADGHIAIEAAESECCVAMPEEVQLPCSGQPTATARGGPDECGPCLDVPVPRSVLVRAGSERPSNDGPANSEVGRPGRMVVEPILTPRDGLRRTPDRTILPTSLDSLRTTILQV